MMNSKDKLAEALREAGLHDMARKAREGYYHDFESPLADPAIQLDRDLAMAQRAGHPGAGSIRQRHHQGEFDAGLAESEAWAESPEGRAALEELISGDSPERARERLRVATLMGDAIRALCAALPGVGVIVLVQKGQAGDFDCATNIRAPHMAALLRAYADHIETLERTAPHDA